MQHFKRLHVAQTLQDLNQITNTKFSTLKKIPRPKDTAKRLYQESQSDPLDEERTYILLSRFLNVYDFLLKIDDRAQIELLLGKEANKASTQLENVKTNLIKRYEEEGTKKGDIEMVLTPANKVTNNTSVFKSKGNQFISCVELHQALKAFNLLIMDVRDVTEFRQSHIRDVKCINIPEDLIHSGLSAHTLGITLPKESLEQWEKRDSFDVIVLMDWYTSSTNYVASRLDKLRTILLEWDIGRSYNEPPVILNNGYSEWLDMYPTLCTGPNIRYSKANAELDELLNLDAIEYPYDSPSKPIEVKIEVIEPTPPSIIDDVKYDRDQTTVVVDRKEANAQELLKQEEEFNNIQNKIVNEYDISVLGELKRAERVTAEAIAKLRKEEKELNNKTITNDADVITPSAEVPKPSSRHPPSDSADLTKGQEDQRQRLLDQARQAKKPKLHPESKSVDKPVIDRATKPKNTEYNVIAASERKSSFVNPGLTGLVNIKNTCYLNTIIQCLRHIPEIIEFYCNNDYSKEIVRQPPVISKEMGNLIRSLWSNNFCVIKPSEFYNKLTILTPSYKDGQHEDCMEFFIQLFTFLSEDCAFEVTAKNCWSETELAWYKQHVGKLSYFIETFYYQIRIVQSCTQCSTRNLKCEIENVFYLTIPNYNFYLEACMAAYLHDTERFVCKKCKKVKIVHKSICRYPQVLVIALKRHVQDGTHNNVPIFKKNDSRCYFPVENFNIDNVVYSLKAVAMHIGTTESGHYTAACFNPISKGWFLFNDDIVTPFDINHSSVGMKAYAFFYSKTKIKSTKAQ